MIFYEFKILHKKKLLVKFFTLKSNDLVIGLVGLRMQASIEQSSQLISSDVFEKKLYCER